MDYNAQGQIVGITIEHAATKVHLRNRDAEHLAYGSHPLLDDYGDEANP